MFIRLSREYAEPKFNLATSQFRSFSYMQSGHFRTNLFLPNQKIVFVIAILLRQG